MEIVKIYGFGTYFNSKPVFQDIDILILHKNISYESCQFSLIVKRLLLSMMDNTDITILSDSEERQFNFLEKCKAKYLGCVSEKSVKNDLDTLFVKEVYRH